MDVELDLRKGRGAFFTPPDISQFLVDWAVRLPTDRVLEPSCGDAAFLLPAAARLSALGATPDRISTALSGVEIHGPSARHAEARLRENAFSASITHSDFFDVEAQPTFDAVIGNPPYVRYQDFSGAARAKGLRAALAQGVRLTSLASSWAAFVVHAAEFLKDDGRLGMVLPAELLSVNYAAQVRRFLLDRFSNVRLVVFENLVFPGVLEEVVLLLAEGRGSATRFEVHQTRDASSLSNFVTSTWQGFTPSNNEKWTPALIPTDALTTYRDITRHENFSRLIDWGETYLGAVTGNNKYFTLSEDDIIKKRLERAEVIKISPPGARHLRGLSFSADAWNQQAREGARCYLFAPNPDKLSDGAKRYIEYGEREGVHRAYKCKVRTPWWRVPLVQQPDLLFTYMNHDRPRLSTNESGAQILNSLYGIKLRSDVKIVGKETLPIACLNTITLLGSEIVGRAYGGGLLKHEPKEADQLPVPSPSILNSAAYELRLLRPQLATAMRQNKLLQAVEMVDSVILEKHLRLDHRQLAQLRNAREVLFNRRLARGRSNRVDN